MKKKFLLAAVLPALMVLSSCTSLRAAGTVVKDPGILEDTLAHEEIFGGVAEELKLDAPYRAIDSMSKPVTGVQYKEQDDGKFAIRYVAAITDYVGVEATWTRGVCYYYGNQYKTFEEKPCEKAYTAISAEEGVELPSIAGPEYNYFVVYTLRNIPADQLDSYLFAYLTIKKGESEDRSLARISRLGEGNTFTIDTETTSGYFLQGYIREQYRIVPVATMESGDNYAQQEDLSFNANDRFGLFKYQPAEPEKDEHFQCFGYNQLRRGAPFLSRVSESNYMKAPAAGTYKLYLTKSNEMHIVVPSDAKASGKFYFKPGSSWTSASPRYALYVFNDEAKTNDWISLSSVGSGIYSCNAFSAVTWPNCILVRMNPGNQTNNWENRWSKTKNLSLDDAGNIFYVNDDAPTMEPETGCEGNWNLYLG